MSIRNSRVVGHKGKEKPIHYLKQIATNQDRKERYPHQHKQHPSKKH